MHTHNFSVQITLGSHGLNTFGGAFGNVAQGGTATAAGVTDPSTMHLPFKELVACKLAQDTGQGDGFPLAAVAHFDAQLCPNGWDLHTPANGNIILPAPAVSGLVVASSAQHTHAIQFAIDIGSQGINAASGANYPAPYNGVAYQTGNSDVANNLPPTIALLTCRKSAAPAVTATLPSGVLTFLDDDTCPSSWERYTDADGRFLIAAGVGANIGGNFGGPPLGSGEVRAHTHNLVGTMTLLPEFISASSGNTGGYATPGLKPFGSTTIAGYATPARIELRQCRKQ
jgi:hypothetical protein